MDILVNVLKNLKGNDKFDGMQYLLVSINTIKIKWSPIISQKAITLKTLETSFSFDSNDQTLSNILNTKKDNSRFIFNANNLNTFWINQFFRKTLSEFVFENVNISIPPGERKRALMYNVEAKDKNENCLYTSTSSNVDNDISNLSLEEAVTESHQKRKAKKKQHSTYKCVICEKRQV